MKPFRITRIIPPEVFLTYEQMCRQHFQMHCGCLELSAILEIVGINNDLNLIFVNHKVPPIRLCRALTVKIKNISREELIINLLDLHKKSLMLWQDTASKQNSSTQSQANEIDFLLLERKVMDYALNLKGTVKIPCNVPSAYTNKETSGGIIDVIEAPVNIEADECLEKNCVDSSNDKLSLKPLIPISLAKSYTPLTLELIEELKIGYVTKTSHFVLHTKYSFNSNETPDVISTRNVTILVDPLFAQHFNIDQSTKNHNIEWVTQFMEKLNIFLMEEQIRMKCENHSANMHCTRMFIKLGNFVNGLLPSGTAAASVYYTNEMRLLLRKNEKCVYDSRLNNCKTKGKYNGKSAIKRKPMLSYNNTELNNLNETAQLKACDFGAIFDAEPNYAEETWKEEPQSLDNKFCEDRNSDNNSNKATFSNEINDPIKRFSENEISDDELEAIMSRFSTGRKYNSDLPSNSFMSDTQNDYTYHKPSDLDSGTEKSVDTKTIDMSNNVKEHFDEANKKCRSPIHEFIQKPGICLLVMFDLCQFLCFVLNWFVRIDIEPRYANKKCNKINRKTINKTDEFNPKKDSTNINTTNIHIEIDSSHENICIIDENSDQSFNSLFEATAIPPFAETPSPKNTFYKNYPSTLNSRSDLKLTNTPTCDSIINRFNYLSQKQILFKLQKRVEHLKLLQEQRDTNGSTSTLNSIGTSSCENFDELEDDCCWTHTAIATWEKRYEFILGDKVDRVIGSPTKLN